MQSIRLGAFILSVTFVSLVSPCARAGVPDLYDLFSAASRIDRLAFELDAEVGADLTGDGEPDNTLGGLLGVLSGFLTLDFNTLLQEQIDQRALNVGLIWFEEDEVEDAENVITDVVSLVESGGSRWLIDRTSFEAGTDRPLNRIEHGVIEDERWSAEALRFPIVVPLAETLLELSIIAAHLEADLLTTQDGWLMTHGSIAGVVTLGDFFGGINEYLRSNACACLGLTEDPIFFDEDENAWQCREGVEADACGAVEETCRSFAEFCTVAVTLFTSNADVDTDLDGTPDALSLFVHFTAEPATLVGIDGVPDCDGNGIADEFDIESGALSDENGDGIPDECISRVLFHRGDADSSGSTDLSDGIKIFNFLFLGGEAPSCAESADANNSGAIDISDGISLLNFLFLGGPPPAPPGAFPASCGSDPDVAGSEGDLGCENYPAC